MKYLINKIKSFLRAYLEGELKQAEILSSFYKIKKD